MRKPCKPLYRKPAHIRGGASVQQGLSAAFEVVAHDWHRGAADKRYSLSIMFYSLMAAGVIVVAVFVASLVVERLLGRSRKEFSKPGWFVLFYVLFTLGCALVYTLVSTDSQFLYAAYALAGGIAALVAQCFFGVKLPGTSRENDNA